MGKYPSDAQIVASVKRNKARYSAISEGFAAFPYGGGATITYDMWLNAMNVTEYAKDHDETMATLDGMTQGGFSRLIAIFGEGQPDKFFGERTSRDFERVMDALKGGAKSDLDETVDLDRFGQPNIAAYMAGCRESVSVPIDKVGSIDLATFVAPWHGRGPVGYLPVFSGNDKTITYDVEGQEWAILPYSLLWSWDMYKVLCNLCTSGYEWAVQSAVAPAQKRPRKVKNMTTKHVVMPNDAITNAFFARDENAIQPWDYFNHDTTDTALAIATGGKGKANVVVVQDASTTIDAAIETYRLTPEDRFWLEAICSLARDGQGTIRGSDLLKFNGYRNPYQKSARDTMNKAYQSVRKMWRIHIAIDTTEENRKRYRNLAESYDEQPLVDCSWRVMRFDDDTTDFEIVLSTMHDGTPLGALPLAVYATDKGQLLMARRTDFEFKTIGKLTLDHRLMWRYVLRRIKDKTTSTTIVFDTVFKNIGLESVERHKRSQMLTILKRMLNERKQQGVIDFTWNRDRNGRAEYSVTITPKQGT